MFYAERWAEAYYAVCEKNGEDPVQGLALFETVLPLAGRLGRVSGTQAADRFIVMVKKAAGETAVTGVHAAFALIWLFVRRGFVKKNAALTEAVSNLIDQRHGVLRAELETATEDGADEHFLHGLESALSKKYGVHAVRITTTVKPELLCGYRWTVDGRRMDYSLAGRLSDLERVLDKTAIA
jgi:F0F1-type ATP synthase delta subunit